MSASTLILAALGTIVVVSVVAGLLVRFVLVENRRLVRALIAKNSQELVTLDRMESMPDIPARRRPQAETFEIDFQEDGKPMALGLGG